MTNIQIFCDFDGTITRSDNIIDIMKRFAPPEWEQIVYQILDHEITIQTGVGQMFQLLPSSKRQEITQFVLDNATLREGFAEFIEFVNQQDIPFYVISGGIDLFVQQILKPFPIKEPVYCNRVDVSEDRIRVLWPHSCDDQCEQGCGCCKPSVMRRLAKEDSCKLVIGDSITDVEAAKQADHVYACKLLLEKCKELGLPYTPFETFGDIQADIKQRFQQQ